MNQYPRTAGSAAVRYARSQALLAAAEPLIPLGTQTFSKSYQQLPRGAAPLFLARGKGGRVWDVDGNEYVDMVCGLLSVVLGYGDPDVDAAIRKQLESGISFSLATELEYELARRLVEAIPGAERVRFGKNGTDATSACIRIARAATGRDRVVVIGYHGWQDWYVGATARGKGVPKTVAALTHRVPYNDLDALDRMFRRHPGEVAAVILEPMTGAWPKEGYLEALRDMAHRNGALVVFDEVVTGLRLARGGAQAYFGVTPDLCAFGKALGNGMPISVAAGRADLMAEFEEVFLSATFGGEALSLAAAIAVLDKMAREPVVETLWRSGEALAAGARVHVARHGLKGIVGLIGAPPWMILAFADHPKARKEAIKTLFLREMLANGVLIAASHNVCYAHSEADVAQVLGAWDAALGVVAAELATGYLEERLGMPPILPVFAVRD